MVSSAVYVDHFQKIDHITALARPGPLSSGMMEIYANRASGREPVEYKNDVMRRVLKNTFGVILYQEQIMMIVREVGQFDWAKTSVIRKAMSGRKGEEYFNKLRDDFVEGAVPQGYTKEDALEIWDSIVSYGSWAFNASHSVSYAVISYWCCWLKAHYALEWAAANLRAAKDDTQTIEILREMAREGVSYQAIDPLLSGLNWEVRENANGERVLVGGIMNAKGYGPVKAMKYIQKRDAGELTAKDIANLEKAEIKYTDLQEATTLWGHLYERPALINVLRDPISKINDVRDGKEGVFIAQLKKKVLDSENDPKRIKKRGGKVWKDGPPEFLDLHMVDDSVSSVVTVRIRPEKFQEWGVGIYENAEKGSWWLIRGWKIPDISMFIAKKMFPLKLEKHGRKSLLGDD
ncbi:DNA polymerase III alpha subunit [Aeromonas phage Gekk3-15]